MEENQISTRTQLKGVDCTGTGFDESSTFLHDTSVPYFSSSSAMRIQILGSGAYPLRFSKGRSFCMFFPEHNVVLDGGLGLLAFPETATGETLTIVMSHYHHDHIIGLASLNAIIERKQFKHITIVGDERIEKLGVFFREPFNPDYPGVTLPITLSAIGTETTIGTLQVKRQQVGHASGASNLYRFTDATASVGVSTDTTADVANANFFQDCDLLLHECNYDNAHEQRARAEGHSYPEVIAALAHAAHVKKLGLIHTDPRYPAVQSEMQKAYPGAWVTQDDDILNLVY